MKRLFPIFLLLLSVLILFAACGGGTNETETTTADATTGEATTAPSTSAGTGPYDVTFRVGNEETKATVEAGETPEFTGNLSWETSEHYYKIIGWEPELVPADADATYTAVIGEYGLTLYDIRFNMPNGLILVKTHEGEIPTPPPGYDAPHLTVDRVGTFTGWDKELVAPTAENMANGKRVIYTAVYSYETRYYSVTFKIGDAEYPLTVAAKEVPECPVTPEADGMLFARWDHEVAAAVEDTVYSAVFMTADCPTTFTVATWNIGHFANGSARDTKLGDSQYEEKSAEYREYIEGLDADILCLNEYSRLFTPHNEAPEALFEEVPAVYFAGEQRHFSCNAVFSDLPLQNIQVHDFECNKDVELLYSATNRAYYYYYLTAEMEVGGETIHFVFTHLAFDEDRSPDTVCQAQIAELIALYENVEHVVMMGDWNAYYSFYYDPFDEAGYTVGNYGKTLTCIGSRTGGLEWAVDDIIVKGLELSDFHAVNTGLSDHIAVVATISLPEK